MLITFSLMSSAVAQEHTLELTLEETIEQARQQSPDAQNAAAIPIFAMTANAFTEDRRRAYDSGMNEHLTKPLEPDTLLRTLAKYLQR